MSTRMRRRRVVRREQAAERQAAYDGLTVQQKYDRTFHRSLAGLGPSRRETMRLVEQGAKLA